VVLAGLGGAVNASLVLAGIPVSLENKYLVFEWHLIPAGFLHGAILALCAWLGTRISSKNKIMQWAVCAAVGYLAGWLSGIPLTLSISDTPRLSMLWWPLDQTHTYEIFLTPYLHFGLVSSLYYFFLVILDFRSKKTLPHFLVAAAVSGALGSLYWWLSLGPWYNCLIHGAIWGAGAGFGFWKQRR
jgi:hypothetical protein